METPTGTPHDVLYLAETQVVTYYPADPVFGGKAEVNMSVIVDRICSTVALAERACDERVNRYSNVEVLTQFKPSAIGGITDRHGGAVSWERTLRWTGLTEGEAHVSWQSITAMRVDQD